MNACVIAEAVQQCSNLKLFMICGSEKRLQGRLINILDNSGYAPVPPPTQAVTMEYFFFNRFRSWVVWMVSLQPVQPRGWPKEMAPPIDIDNGGVYLQGTDNGQGLGGERPR